MKITKIYITLCFTLLMLTICNAQNKFKTIKKDFEKLTGSWQGSLTYLDYTSGKPYTMPADIEIKRIDKTNKFIFSNIYPNETNANSTDTVSVSSDGKYIDKETVKSRRKLPNGEIEIITEELGNDGNDNRAAMFRHTYTLGATTFRTRKDVQFIGETEWIKRHEYSYKRNSVK